MHLIGRSPAPRDDAPWRNCSEADLKALKTSIVRTAVAEGRSPDEDWTRIKTDLEIHKTLGQFREAGVYYAYHSCDISDWDALARTLDGIRAADGPIEGIIHGAGYAKAARFEQRERKHLERTLAAKVDGAVALMALTQRDPLRWFVGFGSLSGRWGGNGLSDYAAANDLLAKLIDAFRRRRPQCAAVCIHWQTWDEVGMATFADGVAITKNVLQMAFIPPREGVEHLHQELAPDCPAPRLSSATDVFSGPSMRINNWSPRPSPRCGRPCPLHSQPPRRRHGRWSSQSLQERTVLWQFICDLIPRPIRSCCNTACGTGRSCRA